MSENNENIPLEEMMRNLKRGEVKKQAVEVDGGKRVIRADGSEAIKVRTKKRRSVQPKEEAEKKSVKRKIILIASAVGLMLLSVIAFSFLLGYYNGNRFKSNVSQSITNLSGANVELGALDVNSSSSKLSKVQLLWDDPSLLVKNLAISGLVADCGVLDLMAGGLGVSTVGIDEASLELALSEHNPNFQISSDRPFDYPFSLYQCSVLSVDFGEGSSWGFENGSVSYRPGEESGHFNGIFSVASGDFRAPVFGDFKVRNGLIELGAQEAKVYMGLDSVEHDGQINVDGVSGYARGSVIDLKTKIKNYSLRGLLESKSRRFFHGKVESGEGVLKMKLGDVNSYVMSSDLVMRDVRLSDFPFINVLAELMDDDYYANPVLSSELTMTVKRSAKVTEFVNIDLKQELFMCLKGNLIIDDANFVNGSLELGLPVTVLSGKNGKLFKSVFKDDDGEFLWATVQVSGSLSEPKDDLKQQIDRVIMKSDEQDFEDLLNQ